MFIKPFYFHRQISKYWPNAGPRGLSIKIQPETGFTEVIGVSITHCNPKDQFNKKEARRILETKEVEIIETKKLPQYVADKVNKALGVTAQSGGATWQTYAYLLKYVL